MTYGTKNDANMLCFAHEGAEGMPLGWRDRLGDWRARMIRYYILPLRYLRRHFEDCRRGQQMCKICGQADGFDFHVPDETWAAIVPHRWQRSVVCLRCFDRFAKARGVEYKDALTLYFAGEMHSFDDMRPWGAGILPNAVKRHGGRDIRVMECEQDYDGVFIQERDEIRIRKGLRSLDKRGVLFHEMLHAASCDAKAAGEIKRGLPERVVDAVGWRLFMMLALSELWAGLSVRRVAELSGSSGEARKMTTEEPKEAVA